MARERVAAFHLVARCTVVLGLTAPWIRGAGAEPGSGPSGGVAGGCGPGVPFACGQPGAGDCFIPDPSPGCVVCECCAEVCANDPFCCDTAWDIVCVNLAVVLCSAPCDAPCPGGALSEPEPCGADTNGGCDSVPPMFTQAACGQTWCGTTWASGGTRDSDWYMVNHPGGNLIATVTSEIPTSCFIVDVIGACTPVVVGQIGCGGNCDSIADASASLPIGQYVVFVAPGSCHGLGFFDGFPCGGPHGNDYSLTISGECGCFQTVSDSTECIGAGGDFNYQVVGTNTCTDSAMTFDFVASGGNPGEPMCFTISLFDNNGDLCCNATVCTTVPDCAPSSQPCDLDGDHAIGVTDMLILLGAWNSNPGGPPDYDADGTVAISDFLSLLSNWGPCQ